MANFMGISVTIFSIALMINARPNQTPTTENYLFHEFHESGTLKPGGPVVWKLVNVIYGKEPHIFTEIGAREPEDTVAHRWVVDSYFSMHENENYCWSASQLDSEHQKWTQFTYARII